jgi:hypothetical protein
MKYAIFYFTFYHLCVKMRKEISRELFVKGVMKMKIDRIGTTGIQQPGQVKSVETAPEKVKDISAPVPLAPVKPEGEVSIVGELGGATRSIAGEDLANRADLARPIAEAVDIIKEKRGEV